jgi:hypothetical protein
MGRTDRNREIRRRRRAIYQVSEEAEVIPIEIAALADAQGLTAKQRFEAWAIASKKCSLVAYGSQRADLDYMFFSDENFKPQEIWPGCFHSFSGSRACLAVVGEEYFDIALARPAIKDRQFIERKDMLRNSPKPPVWICDPHGLSAKFSDAIRDTERDRMTDEEIVNMLRGYYVNLKFIQRKIFAGPLYARFLLLHSIEPTITQLCRQYDLRRGGVGKYKGRDAEKTFTVPRLKMICLRAPLDTFELAKELFGSVEMVKFWCKELGIPVPDFINKITW